MSFGFDLKLFALDERQSGKTWGEIRKEIKEKYKIDPPTVRSLQMWEKESPRGILSQALEDQARKESEAMKSQALTKVAEELLPRLWQAKDAGEDLEYEGWKWFFSLLQANLGEEKFNRFLTRYLQEQQGKKG